MVGLALAVVIGGVGLVVIRSNPPKPRIIDVWPSLKKDENDTPAKTPPSLRRSFDLKPLSADEWEVGGPTINNL